MNIRIKDKSGAVKDVNNVRDTVKEIQRIYVGNRAIDIANDVGGDVAYRRTDEVEDGRVVFQ